MRMTIFFNIIVHSLYNTITQKNGKITYKKWRQRLERR